MDSHSAPPAARPRVGYGPQLPPLTLDISDSDVPSAADGVADWLEATGGLTLEH
jgi:hypothetical protein